MDVHNYAMKETVKIKQREWRAVFDYQQGKWNRLDSLLSEPFCNPPKQKHDGLTFVAWCPIWDPLTQKKVCLVHSKTLKR